MIHRLFIILFIFSLCACESKELSFVRSKYGRNYNIVRLENKMPVVDDSMVLAEDIEKGVYRFWYPNKKTTSAPRHVCKRLLLDTSMNLHFEQDHYYNPVQKMYLTFEYSYFNKKQRIYLSENDSTVVSNPSADITIEQADSVLRNWKIVN